MGRKSRAKKANQPCSCGSGKKAKNCCGLKSKQNTVTFSELPEETQKLFRELQKKHENDRKKYGHVGSPIGTVFNGVRLVAVGNKLVPFNPRKTYLDFLSDYMKTITGNDWGNNELKKPDDEQHQIIKLYKKVADLQKEQKKNERGFYELEKTGTLHAWYQLAYDLHVLSHYSVLHESVLSRLKIKDQFQGARYELSVTAAIIRAGFEIEHQNEKDRSTSHFEFTAKDRDTGEIIAVEAKSKHRSGVLDYDLDNGRVVHRKINVKRLLGDALKKDSQYPLVIFVDLNMPPLEEELQNSMWIKELEKTISNKEKQYKDGMPANVFIFTNHPHHYEDESTPNPMASWMLTRATNPKYPIRHVEIVDKIAEAVNQYGNIPNFFEDQEP